MSGDRAAAVRDGVGVSGLDAIAYLLADRSTALPLAVGVFGGRGTGKSHSLALLRRRLTELAHSPSGRWSDGVLQVAVNAQQTADRDPWPALASAVFAGVSGYVHDPPDHASFGARDPRAKEVAGRLADVTARIDEVRRERSSALVDITGDPAAASLLAASRDAVGIRSDAVTLWRLASPRRRLLYLTTALLVVALIAVSVLRPSWYSTGLAVTAAVAGAVAVVRPWLARVRLAATRELELQQLLVEREAVEAQLDSANRTAGRLDLTALARRWSDIDAATKSAPSVLRAQFEALADLLSEGRAESAGPPRTGPSRSHIDRIVVYVDGLDRCPPRYAVTMLETLKQLLDVPLFALVVAVDTAWLATALREYRGPFVDVGGPGAIGSTQDYLFEMFDIGFSLTPLPATRAATLIEQLVPLDDRAAPLAAPPAASLSPEAGSEVLTEGALLNVRSERLGQEELELLTSLAPLFDTPRQVKRYVNLYRLMRASTAPPARGQTDDAAKAFALLVAVAIGRHRALADALFRDLMEHEGPRAAPLDLVDLAHSHALLDARGDEDGGAGHTQRWAAAQWAGLAHDLAELPLAAFPDQQTLRDTIPLVSQFCLHPGHPN